MTRIVLTQTRHYTTQVIDEREVADQISAIIEPAYEVNGSVYPVRTYRLHDAAIYVDLELEPREQYPPTRA